MMKQFNNMLCVIACLNLCVSIASATTTSFGSAIVSPMVNVESNSANSTLLTSGHLNIPLNITGAQFLGEYQVVSIEQLSTNGVQCPLNTTPHASISIGGFSAQAVSSSGWPQSLTIGSVTATPYDLTIALPPERYHMPVFFTPTYHDIPLWNSLDSVYTIGIVVNFGLPDNSDTIINPEAAPGQIGAFSGNVALSWMISCERSLLTAPAQNGFAPALWDGPGQACLPGQSSC